MDYKTGDIILVEGRGLFGLIIRFGNCYSNFFKKDKATKYSHAGIMINEKEIIEALPEGVTLRDFPYKKDFSVFRKKKLTSSEQRKLASKALQQKGESYSWYLIIVLGFLKILRLEWLINGTRRKGEICSVVVAKCYKDINYYFKESESVDFVDPMDIAEKVIYLDKNNWEKVK